MPTTLFAALAIAGVCLISRAELSPRFYEEYQKDSPEALTVKVMSVKIVERNEDRDTRSEITAEARVESVTRSASGLRPRDAIRITYSHFKSQELMLGPSQPDILKEGHTYPAYLEKTEGDRAYTLAAEGYSFRAVL